MNAKSEAAVPQNADDAARDVNLEVILDVPVTLSMEVGRTRIAIPEPRSGYIEIRGEVSEDDNISISLLCGTHPIALPSMSPGQVIKIQIESS